MFVGKTNKGKNKMAKLSIKKTVSKKYSLELTQEELIVLFITLRYIGGDPKTSCRKITDDIHDVIINNIDKEEVEEYVSSARSGKLIEGGSIDFKAHSLEIELKSIINRLNNES